MKNRMLVISFSIIALVAIALFLTFHSATEAKAQNIPVTGSNYLALRQAEEFLHSSNAIPLVQDGINANSLPAASNPSYLQLRGAWEYLNASNESANTYSPDYLQLRQEWEFVRVSAK